jgi:Flp pilus assembly protein TadG
MQRVGRTLGTRLAPGGLSRHKNRSERGASAVEFAIVLSLLLMIVFGVIQFGIALNRNQGLQAAAREGARIASIGSSQSEIVTRVKQSQSLFNTADILVKIESSSDNGSTYSTICNDASGGNHCDTGSSPCGTAGLSNLIRVTASVPPPSVDQDRYAIIIPFWGNAKITFSADGVFRCEQTS